jgi:hypothetical protein
MVNLVWITEKGECKMTNKQSEIQDMPSSFRDKSHRRIALIAGFGLLIGTISILLAEALAMAGIVVEGDAAATVENIISNQVRFRLGITGHLIMIIMDMVVAWALYVFLKPSRDSLSLLAAWFRVVYSIIYGIAVVNLYNVLQLLGNPGFLSIFGANEIQSQVMLSLGAFSETWDVAYIFFGVHLALLGIVAFRSGFVPKVFGIILALGGLSYLIDYGSLILLPDFGIQTSLIFGFGELIFMLWLLIRGGKADLPASS